jgi:hypothetical protein
MDVRKIAAEELISVILFCFTLVAFGCALTLGSVPGIEHMEQPLMKQK